MDNNDFIKLAKQAVVDYFNDRGYVIGDKQPLTTDDVYVVWLVKVLQNNKALLSTTFPDGRYYEFTLDGGKNRGYLDVYAKQNNVVVPV